METITYNEYKKLLTYDEWHRLDYDNKIKYKAKFVKTDTNDRTSKYITVMKIEKAPSKGVDFRLDFYNLELI